MVSLEKQNLMNPWWTKADEFDFWDPDIREYSMASVKIIRKAFGNLKPNNIYILKGPRRVGKTLSMKQLTVDLIKRKSIDPRNIFYFSFDTTVSAKETDSMLREFLNRPYAGTKYMLLDEVQNVKDWDKVLMNMHDSGFLANVVTMATGSVAKMLSETMVGRDIEGNIMIMRQAGFNDFVLSMLEQFLANPSQSVSSVYNFTRKEAETLRDTIIANPITMEESPAELYGRAQQLSYYTVPLSRLFEIYLRTGGYPSSINAFFTGPQNKIFNTKYEELANYVYSDAANIAGSIGDPAKAKGVVQGVLQIGGNKVSFSKVGRLIGMNAPTTISYFNRLENSYAFVSLDGLDKDFNPVRLRKIYFSDIFLHYAAGASYSGMEGSAYTEQMINSSKVGSIVEEMVAYHLARIKEEDPMKLYGTYLNFYSGTGGEEIDFLYRKERGDTISIEVKYKNEVDTRDVKRIPKIKEYVMITKDLLEKRDNLVCLPTCIFLALLKKSKVDL